MKNYTKAELKVKVEKLAQRIAEELGDPIVMPHILLAFRASFDASDENLEAVVKASRYNETLTDDVIRWMVEHQEEQSIIELAAVKGIIDSMIEATTEYAPKPLGSKKALVPVKSNGKTQPEPEDVTVTAIIEGG